MPAASPTWYFAEGATHSGFDLFYLLVNPGTADADVTISYLLPAGPLSSAQYRVGAHSRANMWVNKEAAALAATDVSCAITSSQPSSPNARCT